MFTRFRLEKKTDFTQLPNCLLQDGKLSLQALALLVYIMSLPDEWNFTVKGLAAVRKESERTIRKVINELKVAGYCKVVSIRDEAHRIKGWNYLFYDSTEQQSTDNKPQCKIPQSGTIHNVESARQRNNIYKEILNKENLSLSLSFPSERVRTSWEELLTQPRWAKKTRKALSKCYADLEAYPEPFVYELIETAIKAGWNTLVNESTPAKYKRWCDAQDAPTTTVRKSKRL